MKVNLAAERDPLAWTGTEEYAGPESPIVIPSRAELMRTARVPPPPPKPVEPKPEPWWANPVLDWMQRHRTALWLAFWWVILLSWPATLFGLAMGWISVETRLP